MRVRILVALFASMLLEVASCGRSAQPPANLRIKDSPPSADKAIGTAILDEPSGNLLTMYRTDGTTVRLNERAFVAIPDPCVVPHIGPLK